MSKQLFPVEIIDNSAEKLISGHSKRSFVIYNIAICAIVLVVTLSFVVTVEVNTTSRGMIKTPGERVALNSPYSGFITQMSVKENQVVYKGELLMVLNTDKHSSELNKLQRRIGELNQFIADLNRLIRVERDGTLSDVSLQTGLYKQSMNYFVSQMVDLNTRVQNVESNYKRSCRLHEFGDISTADFEPIEAEYVNAQNAVELFFDRQVSSWQSELDSYIVQRRELAAQSAQLNSQKNEAEVRSPVDGIIQRVEGINSGTYLQQGQKLVEISVDSALYVECLVEPQDIGYLQVGQSVRLQVDAFNYNEWGMAGGEICEIFHDVVISQTQNGNVPYFKILCRLNTEYLELANGYRGYLKRGMTVNARFKVTERTLFQLLYDTVDDWMNPNNTTKQ